MSRIARPALAVAACVAILSMSACSSSSSTSSEDSTTHSGEAGASAEAPVTNASEIPSDARTNLSNLSVGQCFQQPTDPADGLMIVDCSAPHWGEVYALTPIDAETLPDFEELNMMAFEACTPAFEEYVGTPYEESSLDATWYFPNTSNWDAGEHVIACVAVPLEAPSLTQSVKDSNL